MTNTCEGPPRRGSADGPEAVSLEENASNVGPNATSAQDKFRNPRAVREARRDLNLEFVHECAAGIRIHSKLVQTFTEIGDVGGGCYALKRLSTAETKCAKWRRDSVPVGLREKGFEAPVDNGAFVSI